MSDPTTCRSLYAIESNEGTKGINVDAFGTYVDPELGDFLPSVRYRERSRLQALAT